MLQIQIFIVMASFLEFPPPCSIIVKRLHFLDDLIQMIYIKTKQDWDLDGKFLTNDTNLKIGI